MKNCAAFLALFLVFSLLLEVNAFLPLPRSRPCSLVSLHPDQASDLEARAYQLVKDAMEQEATMRQIRGSNLVIKADQFEHGLHLKFQGDATRATGPVSWCRKNLWPFRTTDALKSKLP